MLHMGLVGDSSGNASLRLPSGNDEKLILITPSQLPYTELTPDDMGVIDIKGAPVEEKHPPSSETPLHLRVYESRPDVQAIVHCHSIFASVAAVAGLEVPPIIDEMVMQVGGSVKVAEYGFPATEDLAERACQSLEHRNAVLLRNHGLLGVGSSGKDALAVCHLVERVAQIFVYASLLGKANSLPPEIIRMEEELFQMRQWARTKSGGESGKST